MNITAVFIQGTAAIAERCYVCVDTGQEDFEELDLLDEYMSVMRRRVWRGLPRLTRVSMEWQEIMFMADESSHEEMTSKAVSQAAKSLARGARRGALYCRRRGGAPLPLPPPLVPLPPPPAPGLLAAVAAAASSATVPATASAGTPAPPAPATVSAASSAGGTPANIGDAEWQFAADAPRCRDCGDEMFYEESWWRCEQCELVMEGDCWGGPPPAAATMREPQEQEQQEQQEPQEQQEQQVTCTGRIVDAQHPTQGIGAATMAIAGQTITSDSSGHYSVSLVQGSHTFSVSAPGFISIPSMTMTLITPHRDITALDIMMSPAAAVAPAAPAPKKKRSLLQYDGALSDSIT